MAVAYQIRNWKAGFEVWQSKRIVGPLAWVGMPTKHDGKSFRRLIRQSNGPALFACWCLIVQIAAKCPVRGVLADSDGPLTAEDMEDKTGCPAILFSEAIEVLSSDRIGWLETVDLTGINMTPVDINLQAVDDAQPTEPDKPTGPDRTGQITGAGLGGRNLNSGNGNGGTPRKLRALDAIKPMHLPNDDAMHALCAALNKNAPGFLKPGDEGLLQILGASERAIAVGKKPIALFVSIVRDQRWELIDDRQKEAAKKRLADYRKRDGVTNSSGDC